MATENILPTRAVPHKRNVLVLTFIAAGISLTGASLEGLGLFGLTLENSDVTDKTAAIWTAIAVILTYQLVMLVMYARAGWRDWKFGRFDVFGDSKLMLKHLFIFTQGRGGPQRL
jgi:hypothetical protein